MPLKKVSQSQNLLDFGAHGLSHQKFFRRRSLGLCSTDWPAQAATRIFKFQDSLLEAAQPFIKVFCVHLSPLHQRMIVKLAISIPFCAMDVNGMQGAALLFS